MNTNPSSRREFLEFFGRASAAAALTALFPQAAALASEKRGQTSTKLPFLPLSTSTVDELRLAKGFTSQLLISWGDPINDKSTFGFDNDYIAFFPSDSSGTDGVLWVNHEFTNPLFVSGWNKGLPRTQAQITAEQDSVGGSLVRVRKAKTGAWEVVKNDPLNRRITARTSIPLVAPREIQGSKTAIGTLGNCAGGVTPWKTVLTCEENYQLFYGESEYSGAKGKDRKVTPSRLGWEKFSPNPPEHYGWVVEVNPLTGEAKKLTAMGRYHREGATCVTAADGRCVAYSGDDDEDRCIYKFVADRPGTLEAGTLFVANAEKGAWIPLVFEKHEVLKKNFKDQLDVLIRCREAAALVGGSRFDRPEDIEVDPVTGAVYVALTNNKPAGRPYGSILKIEEKGNDRLSTEFKASVFITGGLENGVACPDNLAFDPAGNLWITTDMSGHAIANGDFKGFGNNSLFIVPMSGPNAGRALRVATAPVGAELTGPWFSPDGKSLFLSVQHPGETSKSVQNPTSRWPGGKNSIPKPSVVVISGPALEALTKKII